MFFCLHIGGKEGGVENGVYGPLGREAQPVRHRETTSLIRKGPCLLRASLTDLYGSDKFFASSHTS